MNINEYDELKRKYEALLEENKTLKAKIQELESKFEPSIIPQKPAQSKETLSKETNDKSSIRQPDAVSLEFNFDNDNRVTRYSRNHEKIALFMSLFKGRADVYAKKWQSKKGFLGYSPVCLNEWVSGICNKPRIKCSKCNNQ